MRITIIVVGLVVVAAAVAAVYFLFVRPGPAGAGGSTGRTDERSILAHPYLTWTQGKADRTRSGVVFHNRKRASPGYNVFCSRSRPEAYLMDMDGRVVHMWAERSGGRKSTWVGAHLLADGTLIVVEKLRRVMQLGWNSKVIWSLDCPGHHDIGHSAVTGRFHAIVADLRLHRGIWVRFPVIADISSAGKLVDSWSTFEHLDAIRKAFDTRSFVDQVIDRADFERRTDRHYDAFHLNTMTVVGESLHRGLPAFRPGNLLICFRNVNQIATLDPKTKEILWVWGEGELDWPHHPTLLPNGNVLVFDNGTKRGYSRVVELDPLKKSIVWEYRADPLDSFYSKFRGSSQRLANGNTLICDGENGRAFEVTRRGVMVWEYLHPEISDDERRAIMYRMLRYPTALVDALLEKRGGNLKEVPSWAR